MATENQSDTAPARHPAVAMYGPCTVKGLKEGDVKWWCQCGLSKKQPWCDGSHLGTGFQPMRWVVPKTQSVYEVCACKYTKDPPICDATHVNLPTEVLNRSDNCVLKPGHIQDCKLCTNCGWAPDF